jgi:hypothetical protein
LPDVSFIWNKKDIVLDDIKKNREQDIKIFSIFMKSLNIYQQDFLLSQTLKQDYFNCLKQQCFTLS